MSKIKWFIYKVGRLFEKIKEKLVHVVYRNKFKGKHIPHILQIETTNKCNANCTFCRREFVELQPDMDLDTFKKIIDATPFITEVQLQGFGEPLIDRTIVEKVAYVNQGGKRTLFYTNAATLNEEMSTRLLEAGLSQIRISIDDNTKEGYESVRSGLFWDRVLYNIEKFREKRDSNNYSTTICVVMCITDTNRERLDEIIKFWEERVDFVSAEEVIYIPTPEDLDPKYVDDKPIRCDILQDRLTIKTNGDISLCSIDLYNMYPFGNITDYEPLTAEAIIDVYNSIEFNKVRESLLIGKEMPARCVYCCRNPNSVV